MTHNEIISFVWDVANLIRDSFKRGKYQDVILPLTVLRRLDCVLAPTKQEVLARRASLRKLGLEDMRRQLENASGFAFYNTSEYSFDRLLADPPQVAANLRNYIAGFSANMREVVERFDFDNTIDKLVEAGLLFQVLERFRALDLHPDVVDNPAMGTIFEELVRRFNEALGENPGEHFTPRDVVHLMVDLMLEGDEEAISPEGVVRSVCDPCCGSGGMLMIAKNHILRERSGNAGMRRPAINPGAEIHLFGQEVNPETWAVSKSDFFMKDPSGRDARNIAFGSTLSDDRHADRRFDYLIANPPYGKDWKRDKASVVAEHERGAAGRFGPRLPRISDGQTLFLLHALARAKTPEEGGSRIAIIMNGSPLFTGDAGSGESEIRRYVLENDLLEALIALPEQLFHNTGIGTFVWLLTNRKAPARAGKVQLIDASCFWTPMAKSLGSKRREIPLGKAADILTLLRDFVDGETRIVPKEGGEEEVTVSRILPTTRFGFRKIIVERPLRLSFQANAERIARLDEERPFINLAKSRKRGGAGVRARAEGRALQESIRTMLRGMPDTLYKDRDTFVVELEAAASEAGVKLRAPVKRAILAALCGRDATAAICRDRKGQPEPDPRRRDTERVPLPEFDDPVDEEGIPASVQEFFDREVRPHAPDAWIDARKHDTRDRRVGVVGYEINFNRHFYRFRPPRSLGDIGSDIDVIGEDIVRMLGERAAVVRHAVTKGLDPDVAIKDSGVEWLGRIPAHWSVQRLKTLARMQSGESIAATSIGATGRYPVFGGNGPRGYTSEHTHDGDHILIGRQGAHCGNVHVVHGRFWASEHAIVLSPNGANVVEWCGALLEAMHLNRLSVAAAQPGLAVDRVRELRIPVPPPAEQRAIAGFLGRETTRTDALVGRVNDAIARLEEYRTALIRAAVTGRIDARQGMVRDTPAPRYGNVFRPGGYRERCSKADFDRGLCLIPRDVIDFLVATQPQAWERLKQHHGADVRRRFLSRLAKELERRGALDVLRRGVKDSGCKFQLAYFRPASGLNAETRRLHAANIFAVVRHLRYAIRTEPGHGSRTEPCLDLALLLNGIPFFTAGLKNPLTGHDVQDAIRQYRKDCDPREPLLAHRRCLAHFAVDPELVYVTTHLQGPGTRFLPFNRGRYGGAGNPPVSPTGQGYATDYLWQEIWAPDSVLDLIRQFVHEVEGEDGHGRRATRLIFPRYHQLDAVRRMVSHARSHGAGQRYLIQHSAGSGKSFTIAWLAHQLSTLHDTGDRLVFDSNIVITDRRVLDRQLQRAIRQFEQTLGVVENIDRTSRQLRQALESGKRIIVTTLQKFPVIAEEIGSLPGRRFAVIVDEAHSSQSGESSKSLNAVLASGSLEAAEAEEAGTAKPEATILAQVEGRGPLPNVSTFAFTATPKSKTLELCGVQRADGRFEPFHCYSMRQAIEEGFILDVLANYTTYSAYWRLRKTIAADPRYEKKKAGHLLKSFAEVHPHAIGRKVEIMVEHFASEVQDKIGGRAKAMIVTRSRLHAVRYKLALDACLAEKGHPWKCLVAFSGKVRDQGKEFTEPGMNSVGGDQVLDERQTAAAFAGPEYRFLVLANKFQTGFDQPLLHTMYVDKKLGGVNAVQTLSRLNRTHPGKDGTAVLDFANEAEHIRAAFEPYYEATILSDATDPNLIYDIQRELLDFGVYSEAEVDAFAEVYFGGDAGQDQLYAVLGDAVGRFGDLDPDARSEFRSGLRNYNRLYSFLAQILTFVDADLEKLRVLARYLQPLLPAEGSELPWEVQQSIDMESYRIQRMGGGGIPLSRGTGTLEPRTSAIRQPAGRDEVEPLSRIIAELNERFGLHLGPEHRVTLRQMMDRLEDDPALDAAARVNTRENVRLTFDHKVEEVIQDIVDSNFELYKRITDDRGFGEVVKTFLFDQYLRGHRNAEELIKRGESKTLEFKSTLRWNLKENRKDVRVTYASLKTIAAFLNTEGGDLLLGVADDGSVVGMERDRLGGDDRFMLHLAQVVRNALGDRAGTCIDPKTQMLDEGTVCVVSCRRSPEPVLLRWKGMERATKGDFFVRSGPGTVKLPPASAREYIRTRFG